MIYFIGGKSQSGKTLLSVKLQQKLGCSIFHVDDLMHMLRNNIPEYGPVMGISKRRRDCLKPLLLTYLSHQRRRTYDTIIEGDVILPEDIAQYRSLLGNHRCTSVFLGYPNISIEEKYNRLKRYSKSHPCWIFEIPEEERVPMVKHLIEKSKELEQECHTYDQTFIDTGQDFQESIRNAIDTLISKTS